MPTTFALAPAKVNLSLDVLGRRADGFHDLASLVAFVDLCDTVAVRVRPGAVECVCAGVAGENLAARAAEALGVGAAIRIDKRIPVGAGLGGGSADAAAVLRALGAGGRTDVARSLGADVPACLASRPAWMTGSGDRLAPVDDLPDFALVLAVPRGRSLSTAEMYRALARPARATDPSPAPRIGSLDALAALCANDFEPLAAARVPAVATALAALRASGACAATITGKGPAAFGLFATLPAAREATGDVARRLGADFAVLAVRRLSA